MKKIIYFLGFIILMINLNGCKKELTEEEKFIYQIAVDIGYKGSYEEWLNTDPGTEWTNDLTKEKVSLRLIDNKIHWANEGKNEWVKLIPLHLLINSDKQVSENDIIYRINGTFIQWRYTNESNDWTDLISLNTLAKPYDNIKDTSFLYDYFRYSTNRFVYFNYYPFISLADTKGNKFEDIRDLFILDLNIDKQIELKGYPLLNRKDEFYFTPTYTGSYTFSSSLDSANIQLILDDNEVAIGKGKIAHILEKNKKYLYKVWYDNPSDITSYNVSINTSQVELGNNLISNDIISLNNEFLVKFTPKNTDYYNFTLSSNGNLLKDYTLNILDENFNIIKRVGSTNNAIKEEGSENLISKLSKNKTYYIYVTLREKETDLLLDINLNYDTVDFINGETQNVIKGDSIKIIKIPYPGYFNIRLEYSSNNIFYNYKMLLIIDPKTTSLPSLGYVASTKYYIYVNAYFEKDDIVYIGYLNSSSEFGEVKITIEESTN